MVSKWLKRRPSVQIALTKWGRTSVRIEVYRSMIGGKPTSSCALAYPVRLEITLDVLHQGTNSLYSSTLDTTSYISCMEYPMILLSEYSFLLLVNGPVNPRKPRQCCSQGLMTSCKIPFDALVMRMPQEDRCLIGWRCALARQPRSPWNVWSPTQSLRERAPTPVRRPAHLAAIAARRRETDETGV